MIFLAVTLGFFAESIRENISNHEHAKLLTSRLVKDLQADTARLQRAIEFEEQQRKTIDTLYFLLQKPISSTDTKAIQQLVLNSYAVIIFNPSNGAMGAIEKELNIKEFANSELPGLMAKYESDVIVNKKAEDLVLRLGEENIEPFMYAHFMPSNVYSVFSKDSLVVDAKMRNLTQDDMTVLSIKIENMGGIILGLVSLEKALKNQAVSMIVYATKEYNLKNG